MNDLPVWLGACEGGDGGINPEVNRRESVYRKRVRYAVTVRKLFCLCPVIQICTGYATLSSGITWIVKNWIIR